MGEMNLSAGTRLAWQVAGDLAFHEKDAFIEPRHLLFGIFSVGKLAGSSGQKGRTDELAVAAKPEADRLDALAARHCLDLSSLRRAASARAP